MKSETILLHGALGTGAEMRHIVPIISGPVQCKDLPGHGSRASETSSLSIPFLAEELALTIEDPVDLIGHSMGGYVALYMAAFFPEKVRKVVTVGTKFDWTPDFAARETSRLLPDRMMEKVPDFVTHLRNLHGEYWQEVVIGTAAIMTGLGSAPALTLKDLEGIEAPVLLMRGELDTMVTEQETLQVQLSLVNSRYFMLVGQPHPISKTDQKELARGMVPFLSE